MSDDTTPTDRSQAFHEELVSICRTATGDSLRSIVHFTPTEFDVVYLRSDLDETDTHETRETFIESERLGFDSQERYRDPPTELDIGEYEYTLRVFSEGFVSRVIRDGHGVLLTTDGHDIDDFKIVAVALRILLRDLTEA